MSDPKLDLSALAATRSLEERIGELVQRAVRLRRQELGWVEQLERWLRPALALAATVALVSWLGVSRREPSSELPSHSDPAISLLSWVNQTHPPAASEVLQSFGPSHVAP
ncbi:MAG TPA: hypothetical protein VFQ61_08280 [Polyangiaceae bacterium]|nr:hypothetical protein [Polyangiaceae bacterium]